MQQILQHIFKKSSLDEIPVKVLQQFTREHPLFAIGHFLLAKKLQDKNDPDLQQQLHKTVLYFHHPLWMEYRLKTSVQPLTEARVITADEPAVEEPEIPETKESDLIPEEAAHQMGEAPGTFQEELSMQSEPVVTGTGTVPVQQEAVVSAPAPLPVFPEEVPAEQEPVVAAPILIDPEPITEEAVSGQPEAVITNTEAVSGQPAISEQLDENQEDPDDTDAPEHVHPQEEKLAFQAYHTVDYFASQGIRLSHEVKTDDKLGKQMKSFTEWLKTMRRLPQVTVEEVLDKTNDKEIEQIAADSLEDNEVLTETMALVLAKQGKVVMAKEIYNKLSLLNPHKSAYFAAKIEDLNKHLT